MADRRFRPKKGKNPESIATNVEFIKNAAKAGFDIKKCLKERLDQSKQSCEKKGTLFS